MDADRPASTSAPDRTPTLRAAPARLASHFHSVDNERLSAELFDRADKMPTSSGEPVQDALVVLTMSYLSENRTVMEATI